MSEIPFQRPLLVIGGLRQYDRARVRDFALRLGAPIYAEPLSGLREDPLLTPLHITAGERMLHRRDWDGVIRVGNVPALRFWRDLEESRRDVAVLHFSDLPFTGLTRGQRRPLGDLPQQVRATEPAGEFLAQDRQMAARFRNILDEEPASELAMVREISRRIEPGTRLYLGNSLPIREWDLVADRQERGLDLEANRGANGIDGQLSTFLGWCAPEAMNVAVVGDLTALYDSNALWILPQLESEIRLRIIVINNAGGRIFSRVPSLRRIDRRVMENDHALSFEPWAAMWGIDYGHWSAARSLIELRPDAAASARAWQKYDALWS